MIKINTQPRAFIGAKNLGDMHGPGIVITGNYRLKRDAELAAHAADEHFEGYLNGKYKRGWITCRRATAQETEKFLNENQLPEAQHAHN